MNASVDDSIAPLPENVNTIFSLSEDSEGNELSPAVRQRFANSKAVDENGRLKVLYHGTYADDFTILFKETLMFTHAKPIWPRGLADEMNIQAVFVCETDARPNLRLRITGATFYRVFLNGRFLHFGPARTARGYARVDEIPIAGQSEKISLVIEAMGYRCETLSTVNQPSFLQAELVADGEVIAYTGRDFTVHMPETHIQKVQRFSKQRHFSESWDFLTKPADPAAGRTVEAEVLDLGLRYLPRRAAYPTYALSPEAVLTAHGTLTRNPDAEICRTKYSGGKLYDYSGAFDESELARTPFIDFQYLVQNPSDTPATLPLTLHAGEYALLDFKQVYAGFFRLALNARAESEIILAFSEDGSPEQFSFARINMHAVVEWLLAPGKYDLLTFEPYTARYVMLAVTAGEISLSSLSTVEFAHPLPEAPAIGDPLLAEIDRAARRTFAHNAVDIYMDCPSRERAGWLCDSYFTAQAEYQILGHVDVEPAFLENFLLRPDVKDPGEPIPDGMLPKCYPSNVSGSFIPQWALWYVLELEQYLNERNPSADREAYRPLITALMNWFTQYENELGLLEKLPGWNFVEWSKANQWVQEINYPTNLLYAEALECCDRIWGGGEKAKADAIRREVTRLSFDGSFFRDHAYRDEAGNIVNYPHISEACQYYAFRFGAADRNDPRFAELVNTVLNVFGPARTDELPEIEKANALMGIYLRLELLIRWEEHEQLRADICGFFGGMAEKTGTLWEYTQGIGSLDHGFASYAAVAIAACTKK